MFIEIRDVISDLQAITVEDATRFGRNAYGNDCCMFQMPDGSTAAVAYKLAEGYRASDSEIAEEAMAFLAQRHAEASGGDEPRAADRFF